MCINGLKECLMEEFQPNQCEHEERGGEYSSGEIGEMGALTF